MASNTTKAREIGGRISQARVEAGGMTQVELAQFLKVAQRTMQAYEQGEIIPYKHLRTLERVLNRPVAWFLHGDDAIQAPSELHDEIMASCTEINRKLDLLLARA